MTSEDHGPHAPAPTADELVAAIPHGVVTLAGDGAVLAANASAHGLVAALGTSAVDRCSDLFSCAVAGGPCERECLVARALRLGKPSQEVRIDADGTSPGAVWVTAAPLTTGRHAVLLLRPGSRRDRRQRSQERWRDEPDLRIRVLGTTQVSALADGLGGNWLGERPGRVLKLLVCERARAVTVDEIAEAVWPRRAVSAVSNVRYSIHRLRTKLEPARAAHSPASFVITRMEGYALNLERVWIDADEFERGVEEGRGAMSRWDPAVAEGHLVAAMALYRGPFLADEPYADWAVEERGRLGRLASYALRVLTMLARERGDRDSSIGYLERLCELEPLDNQMHRELIQALLGAGGRSDAERRYERFAARLWRDLGMAPDFDLTSLAAQASG